MAQPKKPDDAWTHLKQRIPGSGQRGFDKNIHSEVPDKPGSTEVQSTHKPPTDPPPPDDQGT